MAMTIETYDIPTAFPTLQDAIDFLHPRSYGKKIILKIAAGHKLTRGVAVADGDFRNFYITSTSNAVVELDPSFPRTDVFAATNAYMPTLACAIDAKGLGLQGYSLTVGSQGLIAFGPLGSGVRNAAQRGLYATDGSSITARNCNFSGARGAGAWITRGSNCNLEYGNFSNCGSAGIESSPYGFWGANIRHGSNGNLELANFSNSFDSGLVVSRARVDADQAIIQNAGRYGLEARYGSQVTFLMGDVSGARILGGYVREGSTLEIVKAVGTNGQENPLDYNIPFNTLRREGIIYSSK